MVNRAASNHAGQPRMALCEERLRSAVNRFMQISYPGEDHTLWSDSEFFNRLLAKCYKADKGDHTGDLETVIRDSPLLDWWAEDVRPVVGWITDLSYKLEGYHIATPEEVRRVRKLIVKYMSKNTTPDIKNPQESQRTPTYDLQKKAARWNDANEDATLAAFFDYIGVEAGKSVEVMAAARLICPRYDQEGHGRGHGTPSKTTGDKKDSKPGYRGRDNRNSPQRSSAGSSTGGRSKDDNRSRGYDRKDKTSEKHARDTSGYNSDRGRDKRGRSDAGGNSSGKVRFSESRSESAPPRARGSDYCSGCGRDNHSREDCRLKSEQGFNTDASIRWKDSAWAKNHPQYDVLPWSKSSDKPNRDRKSSEYKLLAPIGVFDHTRQTCQVLVGKSPTQCITTNALIDTGALQGDYGSVTLGQRLKSLGVKSHRVNAEACSVFGECRTVRECLCVVMIIKKNGSVTTIPLSLNIIDMTPFDLIIGSPTIDKNNLLTLLDTAEISREAHPHQDASAKCCQTCLEKEPRARAPSVKRRLQGVAMQPNTAWRAQPSVMSLIDKKFLLHYEEVDDGITLIEEDPMLDLEQFLEPKSIDTIRYFGDTDQQARLRLLCERYAPQFSISLDSQPAYIKAMELDVDDKLWEVPANHTPLRLQTPQKEQEIKRQLDIMLKSTVVTESFAPYYSHVTLAPKPNGKWRFCIDYRRLNNVTKSIVWPIPNIQQTLLRIGRQKPTHFAIIDLTSGYHQLALAANARKYTAFMCPTGMYEFQRVPFGLKGSPAFFQRAMVTEVLAGLVGVICEVYIDDVLIYADSHEMLLERIETVLQRFRDYNIRANPEKTRMGMSEVEYVGHIINRDGLNFSAEKKSKVWNTPLPTNMKQMKAFLGLANYFRDHIRNHSDIVKPLNDLTLQYDKRKQITWNEEARAAFMQIKEDIANCPTLFFVDDHSPIFLHTDASDYGVGGYLFQRVTVDGVTSDRPIAFCSHSLSTSQIRCWKTIEKEAYAIVYAFNKFAHLIRDTRFVLRTDHRNLTFVDSENTGRVRRWKL